MEIVAVPVLTDNYVWLLHDSESGETAAVDPSVSEPVLAAANAKGWRLTQVLNTHWHPDHTGGNAGIQAATGAPITAPGEAERVGAVDRVVAEGDRVRVCGAEAVVWHIPAHTAGHSA
jgi:hydroxyacylglutathione hydrolase